jgi:hypothetical protein
MNHIEPDDLATLALDRVAPEGVTRAHLDECAECRTEYEALARTVALGQGAPDDELEPPPSSVWAAIHGELALAPELAPDPFGPGEVRTAVTATVTEPVGPPPKEGATVTPISDATARRAGGGGGGARRRWLPIAIAAASVGLVAGIAVGAGLAGLGGDEPAPQTVVADATLDPFPGWSATGSALVEEDDAGVRSIVVNLDAEVPATDVREVWLIRSDASGLVSLGLLEGTSGRFVVPAGIDLDEFTLVDVSAEPVDGDPAHSGDSIVRGELQRT